MSLKSKWIGAVSGAVLASAVSVNAQANETPLADEQPLTTPEATLRVEAPTPASCMVDLTNPEIGQESYYVNRAGNGAKIFRSFGYVLPAEGEEELTREYTGCTYSHIEGRDSTRVIGFKDLSQPGTLSDYLNEVARAMQHEERLLQNDELRAQRAQEREQNLLEKRCDRMQRDIVKMSADGITPREERLILQKTMAMGNMGCNM